ncbi:MAG: hypothetical protein FWC38_08430 [Proteobacteria bacterium]|nr:hypothetical protein [Pseudomonadota bacterium]
MSGPSTNAPPEISTILFDAVALSLPLLAANPPKAGATIVPPLTMTLLFEALAAPLTGL